jgi:hypothetical protein
MDLKLRNASVVFPFLPAKSKQVCSFNFFILNLNLLYYFVFLHGDNIIFIFIRTKHVCIYLSLQSLEF